MRKRETGEGGRKGETERKDREGEGARVLNSEDADVDTTDVAVKTAQPVLDTELTEQVTRPANNHHVFLLATTTL